MPNRLTKLFLGEHVDDSFPFRQLGVLGTSSRRLSQIGKLLRDRLTQDDSNMSPLRTHCVHVDIPLRIPNDRVLQHHSR